MNLDRFEALLSVLFNVDRHPFVGEIFIFFDKNGDGLIDFEEFVRGLDTIERGNLEQKIDYCYRMLDVFDIGILDIFTLREVLIRSFS